VKLFKRTTDTARPQARRVLRQRVDWPTRYKLEGSRQGWRNCRLTDISRDGAGVELFNTTEQEVRAYRVIIEVDLPPAVFHLVGDVRHLTKGERGGVLAGLQFTSLSPIERDMLNSTFDRGHN
jgi:PilZ domain